MSLFIAFEGGEGSGKTTQVRLLTQRLRRRGLDVVQTREPGGTPQGRRLRRLLQQHAPSSPLMELLLFNADRALHVEQVLRPALKAHRVVVCDRFIASTLAYQGYGRGLELSAVRKVSRLAADGLEPDLTVLLDLPVEEGLGRKGGTPDRFERESLAFHRRVREGYLELARAQPERWLVVDASKERRRISQAIWNAVWPLAQRHAPTTQPPPARGGRHG